MKWNNFDKDIEIAWKYKGKKYPTYDALCEEYPDFEGSGIFDNPRIFPNNYEEGEPYAGFYARVKFEEKDYEIDYSCDGYDPKERENEEPRRRKRISRHK